MLNNRFVHLHTHSTYSLLDGLNSTKDLSEHASKLGFKSLALTDHGTCGGLYHFQKDCKEAKIKPILGIETYITENHEIKDKDTKMHHLSLLAKNEVGIKNIMNLCTIAEIKGKYRKPRIDFELLKKHRDGIICLTACSAGELSYLVQQDKEKAKKLILDYKDLFKDDYYIEIMQHKYFLDKKQEELEKMLCKELYILGKENNVKVVATNDIHYDKKESHKYHDILLSMQTKDIIKNPNRFTFDSDDFYMKTYDEMFNIYGEIEEVLKNTLEVSEKITNEDIFKYSPDLLPVYKVPDGFKDEEDYLKKLVKDGMIAKGLIGKQEYRDRIKFEMQTIVKCNYTRYFLILWDVLNWAKNNDIAIGSGRGSAVGSLVLYVLDVTKLDPIKYDLLFERFLNPDRVSPPDVDIDFDYFKREEVVKYVERKYGTENCCKIGTYQKLKARSITRYIVKTLDLCNDYEKLPKDKKEKAKYDDLERTQKLSDLMAKSIPEGPDVKIEESYKNIKEFREYVDKFPGLLDTLKHMEKTVGSSGVHASGFVVCRNPIKDHMALRESKGQICCQFEGPEVEELGLLKFDFLGLKNITIINQTIKKIKERYGKVIDIDRIEPNDKKVFDLLNGKYRCADNRGIFQFESYGMSKLLKDIRVDSFEDMIVANALYRPGPLGAGVHELYASYKHGRKKINPLHPKMAEILKSTYSIIVFQESFMKIARELAGFTRGQSDVLRKATGKKKPELLAQQRDLFVNGCIKNSIDKDIANKIFDQIEYFGGYGFNRSHSAAYSFIAYQEAFLKIYYPLEFMCNLLTCELSNEEKLNDYIKEATRMGIVIKKANINKSGLEFRIEKGINNEGKEYEFIRAPLTALKGVGDKSVEDIIKNQPFENIGDFISKIENRSMNCRIFSVLVDAGCMDEVWGLTRDEIKNRFTVVKENIKKNKDKEKREKDKEEKRKEVFGEMSLFDKIEEKEINIGFSFI